MKGVGPRRVGSDIQHRLQRGEHLLLADDRDAVAVGLREGAVEEELLTRAALRTATEAHLDPEHVHRPEREKRAAGRLLHRITDHAPQPQTLGKSGQVTVEPRVGRGALVGTAETAEAVDLTGPTCRCALFPSSPSRTTTASAPVVGGGVSDPPPAAQDCAEMANLFMKAHSYAVVSPRNRQRCWRRHTRRSRSGCRSRS